MIKKVQHAIGHPLDEDPCSNYRRFDSKTRHGTIFHACPSISQLLNVRGDPIILSMIVFSLLITSPQIMMYH